MEWWERFKVVVDDTELSQVIKFINLHSVLEGGTLEATRGLAITSGGL